MPAKTIEETNNITEEINNELFKNIGYDISSLLNISKKNNEIFEYNKGFNLENIELLTDLLYNISIKKIEKTKKFFRNHMNFTNSLTTHEKLFHLKEKQKSIK